MLICDLLHRALWYYMIKGFGIKGTHGQYTGFPPAESSSLDSSMNGSESHTRWV